MSISHKQIRQLYAENPNISGEEIRRRLGQENNPHFWRTLKGVQDAMRGYRPSLNGKKSDGWRRRADHFEH